MSQPAEVQFATFSGAEQLAVNAIVSRAQEVFDGLGWAFDQLSLEMDLAAVHAHTPLRLTELAFADDANFAHDVAGIMRQIDRRTGQLIGHFLPRFAATKSSAA